MAKAETNGTNGELNKAGVYVHKESGAEVIASSDIQADAFVRLGFELQGEYDPTAEAKANAEPKTSKGTK